MSAGVRRDFNVRRALLTVVATIFLSICHRGAWWRLTSADGGVRTCHEIHGGSDRSGKRTRNGLRERIRTADGSGTSSPPPATPTLDHPGRWRATYVEETAADGSCRHRHGLVPRPKAARSWPEAINGVGPPDFDLRT